MAQQKINQKQSQSRLLAQSSIDTSFVTTSGSSTYMTGSNISFDIKENGSWVAISVSLNCNIVTAGSTTIGQGVVELTNGLSGGGSTVDRRVPNVPGTGKYAPANMQYLVQLDIGSYSYSLTARTSTGATNINVDSASAPRIFAQLI